MSGDRLTLRARATAGASGGGGGDAGWTLESPGVGLYARAPERGTLLRAGAVAGVLLVLERAIELVVPDGVAGYVVDEPPAARRQAVAYGDPLLRLRADAGAMATAASAAPDGAQSVDGLVVRAPQAGRFWRHPEPGAPPFVADGQTVAAGRTLGLLEVMKTFNPLKYAPGGGLPARAVAVRFLVGDGDDLEEGQPVLVVVAAGA
ncbi:MAG TPA: biotin/lipoyl-containing protein [Planctomycetota bacterium]